MSDSVLKILVAEDDANDFHLAQKILERSGLKFELTQVANRQEFLKAVEKPFDLVIADYFLDGFSGLEVIEYVKLKLTEVPVILLSGRIGELAAIEAMKAGAFDYVMKDRISLLAAAVERAMTFIRTQKSLKQAESQLLESQKLEAVGLLAASVAHDFNNILTVLNLGLGHVSEKYGSVPGLHYYVENFQQAAKQGSYLTQQLLHLSKKRGAEPESIRVSEVFENMKPLLQGLLSQWAQLEMDCEKDCVLKLPAGQLEQILVNLVVNAKDALNKKDSKITVRCRQENRNLVLQVSDNGSGIPTEIQSKIFSPFFSTKNGKGTGLGLSTVARIVNQAGGKIELQSEIGKGTMFTMTWPLASEIAAPNIQSNGKGNADVKATPTSEVVEKLKCVYLFEDDPFIRDLLSDALQSFGFKVPQIAIPAADKNLEDVSLKEADSFVIDLNLPGVSGLKLAKQIRVIKPVAPIVMTSGYFSDEQEEEIKKLGLRFLVKPFGPDKLAEMLSN